uniref:Calcitonin peptide-like domain-containing protein n=1 Tax=Xiphophorus couchianus TaxID=32473 RepID=A0A3B5LRV1_9TELE
MCTSLLFHTFRIIMFTNHNLSACLYNIIQSCFVNACSQRSISACYCPVSLCMFLSISNSWNRPVSKRCTGLSTCVLGRLSQDIHKLQTYPRTDVGAGTPGKRRSLSELYENYISTYN